MRDDVDVDAVSNGDNAKADTDVVLMAVPDH